jgi:hypothetical protein
MKFPGRASFIQTNRSSLHQKIILIRFVKGAPAKNSTKYSCEVSEYCKDSTVVIFEL